MEDMLNLDNEDLEVPEGQEAETPEGEEELPEGEVTEEEPVDMDEKVPFTWLDGEGKEVEEELSLKELQEHVSFSKNTRQLVEEQNSFINSMQPLIQSINSSEDFLNPLYQ